MEKIGYDAVFLGDNEHARDDRMKEFFPEKSIDAIPRIIHKRNFTAGILGINAADYHSGTEKDNFADEVSCIIDRTLDQIEGQTNLNIVIFYGGYEEAKNVLKLCENIDMMVLGGCPLIKEEEYIDGKPLVFTGSRGVYLSSVAISKRGDDKINIDTLQIDQVNKDLAEAKWVRKIIDRAKRDSEQNENVYRLAYDKSDTRFSRNYIGSTFCRGCHFREYQKWEGGRHAGAFDLLAAENQQTNPDCINCHALIIWEGRKKPFVYPGVQCESCHGPGLKHSEGQAGGMKIGSWYRCLKCHDKSDGVREKFSLVQRDEH